MYVRFPCNIVIWDWYFIYKNVYIWSRLTTKCNQSIWYAISKNLKQSLHKDPKIRLATDRMNKQTEKERQLFKTGEKLKLFSKNGIDVRYSLCYMKQTHIFVFQKISLKYWNEAGTFLFKLYNQFPCRPYTYYFNICFCYLPAANVSCF